MYLLLYLHVLGGRDGSLIADIHLRFFIIYVNLLLTLPIIVPRDIGLRLVVVVMVGSGVVVHLSKLLGLGFETTLDRHTLGVTLELTTLAVVVQQRL